MNHETPSKTRIGSLPLFWCVLLAQSVVAPQAYGANFAAGTGEPDDPYQIASAQQLISIGSDRDLLDKHFVLISDIDLDPNLPGGRVFAQAVIAPDMNAPERGFQGTPFGGRFDGKDFSISNLTISGEDNLGLFGELEEGAQVSHLAVVQADLTGTGGRIGIIAGDNQGTVSHCYGSGTVSGFSEVGGLVGSNTGTLAHCSSDGEVSGATDVGGLVWSNRNKISDCESSGMTTGVTFVGGLVGSNFGTLAHCSSDGKVSGESDVGGLVGSNRNKIRNCESSGMTSGVTFVGGLVGNNGDRNSRISNSHSTGMTAGVRRVGGLVGRSNGGVSLCHSQGTVSGEEEVGGLAGENWGSVDGCYSKGAVSGENKVGGLVGSTVPVSNVTDCYSRGNVSGTDQVGGLIGFWAGRMTQCYSTGGVSGIGGVGGLVGHGNPSPPGAIVNNFWDIETSGSAGSAAGIGLTTDLMQDRQTFLDAGWDFVDEVDNGLHEIWRMPDEGGYPELDFFSESSRFQLPGQGTADDPYLLFSAIELGAIRLDPGAVYKLMAHLDLWDVLSDTAVVSKFTGRFDGNGFVISNLTVSGDETLGLIGELEPGAEVHDLGVVNVEIRGTGHDIGGLVATNRGSVRNCYVTGAVSGKGRVGGLVGFNDNGAIANCYSQGSVSGGYDVGGLAGSNRRGSVIKCYSTALVSGDSDVGGLVGDKKDSDVRDSFWDIETSQVTESAGGVGLSTSQMHSIQPYLSAGWDFREESTNGDEDLWWMPENDYPRLGWQYGRAYAPLPEDGATQVSRSPTLGWIPGGPGLRHDVYFGDDRERVAQATTDSLDIYGGRQSAETLSYEPGLLEWGKTYYWRIDGVNEEDPNRPWTGQISRFTTVDAVAVFTVDDFEGYDDDCNRIFFTWQDGWGHSGGQDIPGCAVPANDGNGTGAVVGNASPPFAELGIVYAGGQSMSVEHNNVLWPWYSEVQRIWPTPQDWTIAGANALSLYFRGQAENGSDALYVSLQDDDGRTTVLIHPAADALRTSEWQEWRIPLVDLSVPDLDVTAIKQMMLGVGDRDKPQAGGTGRIYLDQIELIEQMLD